MAEPLSNSRFCSCREMLCPECRPFVRLDEDDRLRSQYEIGKLRERIKCGNCGHSEFFHPRYPSKYPCVHFFCSCPAMKGDSE